MISEDLIPQDSGWGISSGNCGRKLFLVSFAACDWNTSAYICKQQVRPQAETSQASKAKTNKPSHTKPVKY